MLKYLRRMLFKPCICDNEPAPWPTPRDLGQMFRRYINFEYGPNLLDRRKVYGYSSWARTVIANCQTREAFYEWLEYTYPSIGNKVYDIMDHLYSKAAKL